MFGVGWDDHRGFYQSGYFPVDFPSGLEDEFVDALLCYGIAIGTAFVQQPTDCCLSMGRMTFHKIFPDQIFAVFAEGLPGTLVHIDDFTVFVADGDGVVYLVSPSCELRWLHVIYHGFTLNGIRYFLF